MRKVMAPLRFWTICTVCLLAIGLTSCDLHETTPCVSGIGERVNDVRALTNFDKLIVNLDADVYLHEDNNPRVEVHAQENLLPYIATEQVAEVLEIKTNNCLDEFKTVRIDVYMPRITLLEVMGTGDVYTEKAFESEQPLLAQIKGSGNIELAADAPQIDISIMGSGDVVLDTRSVEVNTVVDGEGNLTMRGTTETHTLRVDGSGDCRAFDMVTNETFIQIHGSGNCEVFVNELLDVQITGSGSVFYKGSPVLNLNVTGTGEVVYVE